MLSNEDITAALNSGELAITPRPSVIQPASVDLHLDDTILTENGVTHRGTYHAEPGEFLLANTKETINLPTTLASKFEGKSSLGRKGMLAHVSAGFIDPGFRGQITLEIVNLSHRPLPLTPGMPIGQVCFYRLDTPASIAYGDQKVGSHYQGQTGPTPAADHGRPVCIQDVQPGQRILIDGRYQTVIRFEYPVRGPADIHAVLTPDGTVYHPYRRGDKVFLHP